MATDYTQPSEAMLEQLQTLERAVQELRDRNRRVEWEKAWKMSLTRRFLLAGSTYGITAFVFWKIAVPSPLSNALIPLTGYLISTLTMPWAKRGWLARRRRP